MASAVALVASKAIWFRSFCPGSSSGPASSIVVIRRSVNVDVATRPDSAPVAVSLKIDPSESSGSTSHVVLRLPSAPARTGNGLWPFPSFLPLVCSTTTSTTSFAAKPGAGDNGGLTRCVIVLVRLNCGEAVERDGGHGSGHRTRDGQQECVAAGVLAERPRSTEGAIGISGWPRTRHEHHWLRSIHRRVSRGGSRPRWAEIQHRW